jgi:3'(2'), 5'-bisphosphate nucleotidase
MSVVALWNELEDCLLPVFAGYRSRISELPIEVKADHTLLTEADVAVQRIIIEAIRAADSGAVIIAEEDERTGTREDVAAADGRVYGARPADLRIVLAAEAEGLGRARRAMPGRCCRSAQLR